MFENALEASVITKTFCFDNNIIPSMAPAFLLYDKGKYENTNFPKKILKTTNFLPAELL